MLTVDPPQYFLDLRYNGVTFTLSVKVVTAQALLAQNEELRRAHKDRA